MTDDLELYQPPSDLAAVQQRTPDDWFEAFGNIIKLAEYVADTEFVPDTMRRRPAAVAAAILTGREMGLSPMVALRMLHIIKGRVGQSAELMRALVLRAGHEIRDIEITDNRVILEGRRRGETDWARANFTVEDARKAKIDLGGYPKDKLYARATTRLCRRKFADIIAGLPSVDELEDGWTDTPEPTVNGAPGAPVQRARKTRAAKAASTQPKPAAPATEPDPDITELLGDDGELTQTAAVAEETTEEQPRPISRDTIEALQQERVTEALYRNKDKPSTRMQEPGADDLTPTDKGCDGHDEDDNPCILPYGHPLPCQYTTGERGSWAVIGSPNDWADHPPVSPGPGQLPLLDEPSEDVRFITPDQLTKLSILLREAGFDDRQARHDFCAQGIGHSINSAKDLTLEEASYLIDVLENDKKGN